MMTLEEIRLKQNPVLSNLLIGMGQGNLVAETLFPRLPQVLRGMTLVHVGHEHLKEYKLRRAPGTITKRIDIQFDGRTYTLDQYSVEVPIPRELLAEADTARRLNVGAHLDISTVAMNTAHAVLGLGYELDAARWATDAANYPATNSVTYTAGSKWSEAGGTPYPITGNWTARFVAEVMKDAGRSEYGGVGE